MDTGIDPRAAAVSGGVEISQDFDSLLAKLIVTGATREQALARAARALGEFVVEGVPTVIPFPPHVVADPAFAATTAEGFTVHTRWIESPEFDTSKMPGSGALEAAEGAAAHRETIVVEVAGSAWRCPSRWSSSTRSCPGGARDLPRRCRDGGGRRARLPLGHAPRPKKGATAGGSAKNPHALVTPMQGTIVKIDVAEGDTVAEGDLVAVLEAMKMEQPLLAHRAGVVSGPHRQAGRHHDDRRRALRDRRRLSVAPRVPVPATTRGLAPVHTSRTS